MNSAHASIAPKGRTVSATTVLTTATTALVLTAALATPAHAAPTGAPTKSKLSTCSARPSVAGLDSVTYADRLVRAWGSGDRAAVGCYATGPVAAALFAQADPGGVHWRRTGSHGAAGTIYVTYHDDARGGSLTVGVQNLSRESDGWHAAYTERLQNEPRALGPIAWADNLVRAWGRGDRTQTAYYATSDVMHALFTFASPGGGGWHRIKSEGTAGTLYVTYRNATTVHMLIVGVSTVRLSQGDAHAVSTVIIS